MRFSALLFIILLLAAGSIPAAEEGPSGAVPEPVPARADNQTRSQSPWANLKKSVPEWPSWLKLGAEIRGRSDNWLGLNGIPGRDNSYYLHRVRLNATVAVSRWMRLVTQAQDSREVGYDRSPVPGTVANSLDLRQGYVELGAGGNEAPWTVRAGRQPLIFGDMRLVSTSNWGNVGPNYDGFHITVRRPGVRLDGFSSTVVIPIERFDRPQRDKRLSGAYSSFDVLNKSVTIDGYAFWKKNLSAVDLWTYGMRSAGKIPLGLDYNVEVALQRGRVARDDAAAWAGHWEVGRRFDTPGGPVRLAVEYNSATGDAAPHDGRYQSFDSLYPTSIYGTAGDFGWRNLHEPVSNVEWQPDRKTKLKVAYHQFWLAERADALYTFSGAVFASHPDAAESRVGGEIDVRWIVQMNQRLQLWIGYAHLFAGPYLRECGKGSMDYPYAMWTYSF